MKSPGFWISRNAFPDKVVISPSGIQAFNDRIMTGLGLTRDIRGISDPYPGNDLIRDIEGQLTGLAGVKLYLKDGSLAGADFYGRIRMNADLAAIPPGIKLLYGFISEYADLRVLPVHDGLYAKAFDLDFDELQNSALDMTTPVAILHKSRDKKWFYVVSATASGWAEASNVVTCGRAELNDYFNRDDFAVVISPKADIYLDPRLTEYYDFVQMGTKLIVKAVDPGESARVIIPMRGGDGSAIFKICYMNKADLNMGYLVYTPRTVIQQAFKLLNAPYGWGGMYGEQDCSRFIQQVFGTVGLILPRNSSAQADSGIMLGEFNGFNNSDAEKNKLLAEKASGGTVILYMKGHIILYLGMEGGRPYGIHSAWGYRDGNTVRVINRVVVSDLDLGRGSKRGSLLSRIKAIRFIAN